MKFNTGICVGFLLGWYPISNFINAAIAKDVWGMIDPVIAVVLAAATGLIMGRFAED